MKTKRIEKKFALHKRTIANLNQDEMKAILGGGEHTCHSCESACVCPTIIPPQKSSYAGTCG
jgi:natural product precursor